MSVSPATALAMAWLMDRHGLAAAPQVPLSWPLFLTWSVAASAVAPGPPMTSPAPTSSSASPHSRVTLRRCPFIVKLLPWSRKLSCPLKLGSDPPQRNGEAGSFFMRRRDQCEPQLALTAAQGRHTVPDG